MGKRYWLPGLILFLIGMGLVYALHELGWVFFSWHPDAVREGILYFLLGCAGTLAGYCSPFSQALPTALSALKELEEKRAVLESYRTLLQERLALIKEGPAKPDTRLEAVDALLDALYRIIVIAVEGKARLPLRESLLAAVSYILIGGFWATALTGGLFPAPSKELLLSQSFLFGLAWAGLSIFIQVLRFDLFVLWKEKDKIRAQEKKAYCKELSRLEEAHCGELSRLGEAHRGELSELQGRLGAIIQTMGEGDGREKAFLMEVVADLDDKIKALSPPEPSKSDP